MRPAIGAQIVTAPDNPDVYLLELSPSGVQPTSLTITARQSLVSIRFHHEYELVLLYDVLRQRFDPSRSAEVVPRVASLRSASVDRVEPHICGKPLRDQRGLFLDHCRNVATGPAPDNHENAGLGAMCPLHGGPPVRGTDLGIGGAERLALGGELTGTRGNDSVAATDVASPRSSSLSYLQTGPAL